MTTSIRSGATDGALQINGVDAVVYNAGGAERKLESLTCTQASGALTFTLNPTVMTMRSATLTSGVPQTVNVSSAVSLVLPSGGTLGFVSTVQSRIVKVLLSTGELAIINLAGGNDLSETGVISTTAISASATANNVFYSTTARTGVAYRVAGAIDAVNTAGTWASPVLVQGMGGQALTAMSSLGYGQTWQAVTRTSGTTYYNTTGKPIQVDMYQSSGGASSWTATIGTYTTQINVNNSSSHFMPIVPPGVSYSTTGSIVAELR